MPAVQRILQFPPLRSYAPEDFLVSSSNQDAYEWFLNWPSLLSPVRATYLYGPKSSGKTHLACMVAGLHGGHMLDPLWRAVDEDELSILPGQLWVLEDIDRFILAEGRFCGLIDRIHANQAYLLCSGRVPLSSLPYSSPDICSRWHWMQPIKMEPLDSSLLEPLLCKAFSDRQLRVSAELIRYILTRLPTSSPVSSIEPLVQTIDHYALQEKRSITISLVRTILQNYLFNE
jgi:chromosomal replication initiation ATPase DnaA